jgi:hypothetical protein
MNEINDIIQKKINDIVQDKINNYFDNDIIVSLNNLDVFNNEKLFELMKKYDPKIKNIKDITEPHHCWNTLLDILQKINIGIKIYYGYSNIKKLKEPSPYGGDSTFYTNKNLIIDYSSAIYPATLSVRLSINNLSFTINPDNGNINYLETIVGSQSIQMIVGQNFMIDKINKNLIDYINPRIYLDYLNISDDRIINNILSNAYKNDEINKLKNSNVLLKKSNEKYKNTIDKQCLEIDSNFEQYNILLNESKMNINEINKLNIQLAIINEQYDNLLNESKNNMDEINIQLEKTNEKYNNLLDESKNNINEINKLNIQLEKTNEHYDNLLNESKNNMDEINKLNMNLIFIFTLSIIIIIKKILFI